MFSQIQLIATGVIIAGLGTAFYFYHVIPMNKLEDRVEKLESIITKKDVTINNLDTKLIKCKDDLKAKGFENFVEGMANEINTTTHPRFTF